MGFAFVFYKIISVHTNWQESEYLKTLSFLGHLQFCLSPLEAHQCHFLPTRTTEYPKHSG